MSVSVRIPTILRTYTGGESEVSAKGDTLAAVLDDLDNSYAGIKGRIIDEQGSCAASSTCTSATTMSASSRASTPRRPKAPRSR